MKKVRPTPNLRARRSLAQYLVLEGHGKRESRVVAARLLREAGSLARLRATSEAALADMMGLGGEAATRFLAALELAESARAPPAAAMTIVSPRDVFHWARGRLCGLQHEELWLLALDVHSRLRAARCVARGGVSSLAVMTRDVLRIALVEAASAFALVHNHPGGDPTPSKEDQQMTRLVGRAARLVGVPLVDHVVVGTLGYRSIVVDASGEGETSTTAT